MAIIIPGRGRHVCVCFELFSINILCIMPADYDLWLGVEMAMAMALLPGECDGEIIVLARLEFHISQLRASIRIPASWGGAKIAFKSV